MTDEKRAPGATLLAIVLGYLAVAGAIGAVIVPGGLGPSAASIVYAGSATVAAIGIWRRRHWAAAAFAVWGCIALLYGMLMAMLLDSGPVRQALFFMIFAAVLWPLYRYVRRLPADSSRDQ